MLRGHVFPPSEVPSRGAFLVLNLLSDVGLLVFCLKNEKKKKKNIMYTHKVDVPKSNMLHNSNIDTYIWLIFA